MLKLSFFGARFGGFTETDFGNDAACGDPTCRLVIESDCDWDISDMFKLNIDETGESGFTDVSVWLLISLKDSPSAE